MTSSPTAPGTGDGQPEQAVVVREDRGSTSILSLNRPAYNAWGPDMSAALGEHLRAVRDDRQIRACILTGAGDRAFSSGVNIKDRDAHSGGTAEATLRALGTGSYPVFAELAEFPKPLVCAVNGYAIGAGFVLSLCSDIVLASENASFRMPQVELGVLPAFGALTRLALWVGRGRAFEIGVAGKKVEAAEAVQLGLASQLLPLPELLDGALAWAERLGALPPLAYAVAKESLRTSLDTSLVQPAAMADLYRSMALRHTADSDEAHRAWRERRTPVFRGE